MGPMTGSHHIHSLPLFPLNTVLCPGGLLPLRIFEVRYLDMIGKCHKNGTPFGVVALAKGSEVRRIDASAAAAKPPTGDAFALEVFHDIGTLATITSLSRPQPGLMLIQCSGTQRMRITQRQQLKHGLWVADVELLAPDTLVSIPQDLQPMAAGLERIVHSLQAQGLQPDQLPFAMPPRMDDSGWVANRWCELLPLPSAIKQQLMALDNPLLRLELVRDFVDKSGISP